MAEKITCYYCGMKEKNSISIAEGSKKYICNECKELLSNCIFSEEVRFEKDSYIPKGINYPRDFKKWIEMLRKFQKNRNIFLENKGLNPSVIDKLSGKIIDEKLQEMSNGKDKYFLDAINNLKLTKESINLVPKEIATKYKIVPIFKKDNILLAKMCEYTFDSMVDLIDLLQVFIIPIIFPEEVIEKDLENYYKT